MRKMSLALWTSTLMACVLLTSSTLAFEVGRRFLDYGNGMINLDQVTYITPQIDHTVTLSEDDPEDYFSKYVNRDMSAREISNLLSWFDPGYLDNLDYYFLRVHGYVEFDNFTLTMVEEQIYLKIPSSSNELQRVQQKHGEKFIQFLEGLRSETHIWGSGSFSNVINPMENTAYFELIETYPRLVLGKSNQIRTEVEYMASSYRRIAEND